MFPSQINIRFECLLSRPHCRLTLLGRLYHKNFLISILYTQTRYSYILCFIFLILPIKSLFKLYPFLFTLYIQKMSIAQAVIILHTLAMDTPYYMISYSFINFYRSFNSNRFPQLVNDIAEIT